MNSFPVQIKLVKKCVPACKPHAPGQPQAIFFTGWQGLGLAVSHHLQAMFDITQETVPVQQLLVHPWLEYVQLQQHLHGSVQRLGLQLLVPAATNQLVTLHQEFHFTDAATPQLDIHAIGTTTQLAIYHALHFANRIKRAKIQILAVHKWLQHLQQFISFFLRSGNGPGLYQGIALPVAAMGLVIMLHGRK